MSKFIDGVLSSYCLCCVICRTNILCLVLLFGLWSSFSQATSTKSKGDCDGTSNKKGHLGLWCAIVTKSLKKAVADPA